MEYEVKVYPATIKSEGIEMDVYIGVVQSGVSFEAYWDSWIDQKIYFNMSAQELAEVAVGDEIAEGDILLKIDKVDPSIWVAEYDPAEYNKEEGFFE